MFIQLLLQSLYSDVPLYLLSHSNSQMQWRYDPDYGRCYLGYLDRKPCVLGSILSVSMCPETATMNSC